MPPAPTPKRNNAQFQPLTTVLRNIIIEYPPGGGVLRELCQNADDAGASKIEFVLDTRTHKTTDILHEGLAQYQGPALLAYSDSMFTDDDFDSLSRIGDSRKINDENTTGKFGRGFNSVYNWTDTPSIISGENLLILDPHCTWSKFISPESPGGPRWDYVEDIKNGHETMRNQLSAYSSIMEDVENPFPGTIIRLPLRTSLESLIVKGKTTSQADIIEVFEKFTKEILDSLLFLRNIKTINMRVVPHKRDSFYATAVVTAEGRDSIKKGFKEVFAERSEEVYEKDFLMDITLKTGRGQEETVTSEKFVVSHYMRKEAEDPKLQIWARENKLFPWIAIATPLKISMPFCGRLFSTLPLPVFTNHPAHIHGLFSITPDRANIHIGGDQTMAKDARTSLGASWNAWLFRECLPHVWIRNINFRSSMPGAEFTEWSFWPAGIQGEQQAGQPWMGVLSLVFQRILERDMNILPTICGRLGRKRDVLFTLDVEPKIREALKEAGCLVMIPTDDRGAELAKLNINRLGVEGLTVASAIDALSKLDMEGLALEHRLVLLEYVLSDQTYGSLGFCQAPLIPILSGQFCGFGHSDEKVFFPLSKKEEELFKNYPRMIDRKKLPRETYAQLKVNIVALDRKTCISAWTVKDAASYCKNYVFNTIPPPVRDNNFILISSPEIEEFIAQFWNWIGENNKLHTFLQTHPSSLDGLWLIPTLGHGIYHKISTTERKISILDVSERYFGIFLKDAALRLQEHEEIKYPVFTGDTLTSMPALMRTTFRKSGYIDDSEDVEKLISWLVENSTNFVDKLNEEERLRVLKHLGSMVKLNTKSTELKKRVRALSLFQEAVPMDAGGPGGTALDRPWISLKDEYKYIGVKNIPVKLHAERTIFIDINLQNKPPILDLELMTCPSIGDIIEEFVIPLITTTYEETTLRAQLVTFVLSEFKNLSEQCKRQLSGKEIVPVDNDGKRYKSPMEIVDISLEEYFFPEEYRIPVSEFYSKYESALKKLGMVSKVDERVLLDRILEYSKNTHGVQEVKEKAEKLIMTYKPRNKLPEEQLNCRWIPASFDGICGLYNASECRSLRHEGLVKYAMPVMEESVSREWEKVLGWDEPLSAMHVLRQLKGATKATDTAALRHLIASESNTLIQCKEKLEEYQWVPDINGCYHTVGNVFPHGTHRDPAYGELSPYFGTLLLELQKDIKCKIFLREMGMKAMPTFCQLKELQDKLAEKGPLDENDLKVALFIVKEVGARFSEEDLDGFKAPDKKCLLMPLKDLTAGSPGPGDENRAVLHQNISLETIGRLRIATFKTRSLDSLVDLDFEDNFAQRESPATAIRDTLKRYAPATTFNEYLANAEDSGSATKIAWILDNSDGYHCDLEKLISADLEKTQGPALFCFNDGEFRKEDFEAIKNIGVGSKQNDRTKIGKFGRGALTMYHWTSVPSFISGDSFVIFDPEEKHLPLNSVTSRPRAGMKLKLQDVRRKYPDQLLPFEGICGFDKETAHFKGTIFRFPMRPSNDKSTLRGEHIDLGKTREFLMAYYKDAMDSLLFLKKIKEIAFFEKNCKEPVWEVSKKDLDIKTEIEGINNFIIHSRCKIDGVFQGAGREWCVISGKKSEADMPNPLIKIRKNNRLEARYGLAALVRPQETEDFTGKSYMTLPLRKSGGLKIPVHVDANMVIQSNRVSIPLEESEMEEGSEWNTWILEWGVAPLYLMLISHLMQNNGDAGYHYWPPYPSGQSDMVSRTISKAFWERLVTSPYELYPPLLTAQDPVPAALKSEKSPSSSSEVVFDLLPSGTTTSDFVVRLLLRLGVNNIVSPPPKIKDYLIECQPTSIVILSPHYFLGHLRRYSTKLLGAWKEKECEINFFDTIFSFIYDIDDVLGTKLKGSTLILQKDKDDIPNLMRGSIIIPLADHNLGTLQQKSSTNCYLKAENEQEQKLLNFVPRISVYPSLKENVVKELINNDLNIKYLEFSDLPRLYKEVNDRRDNELRTSWLKEMWVYYETFIRKHPGLEEACSSTLRELDVYFGCRVAQEADANPVFISPAEFSSDNLPVILDQSTKDINCDISLFLNPLHGLILLDPSAFPQKQVPQELIHKKSGTVGLNRLLQSIRILASNAKLSIEEYIIERFKKEGIEALRQLLDPTSMSVILRDHPQSKGVLEQLPIWPAESGELSAYKSAKAAMLAPDINIPFEGLPESDIFIKTSVAKEYTAQLKLFNVKKMDIDELLGQNVHQGQPIQASKIQHYKSFLRTLYPQQPQSFSRHPLAVDGEKKHRNVDSLYCAKDKYFRAAFRDLQKTHFLLPILQELEFWPNVGLRTNKTESNYLECVRSIQRRKQSSQVPEPEQLVADAEQVYGFLTFDDQDMPRWSSETWAILDGSPFPVKTQIDVTHRAKKMLEVRGKSRFAEFRRAVIEEYESIAWSQCPILKIKPGGQVLSNINSRRGAPSADTVLDHLLFLFENRFNVQPHQIQYYIKDIKDSYKYLQEKKTSITFRDPKAKIWLNIKSEDEHDIILDKFLQSWECSEDLCLGMKNTTGHIKSVQSFLSPFNTLLDHFGVEKVIFPDQPPKSTKSEDHPSTMFNAFCRFRGEKRFFDIIFEVEGRDIGAHKIVLCAASKHFETMFQTGTWVESSCTKIKLPDEYQASAVSAVFDYIYSGKIPGIFPDHHTNTEAEVTYHHLIYQLELSNLWMLEDLKTKLGDQLCHEHFIRPETVTDIQGYAASNNVPRLLSMCDQYIKNNAKLVKRELDEKGT